MSKAAKITSYFVIPFVGSLLMMLFVLAVGCNLLRYNFDEVRSLAGWVGGIVFVILTLVSGVMTGCLIDAETRVE